jgi:ketosteroid isomerase-like protein
MKKNLCTLMILGLLLPITLRAQDAPSRPLKDTGLDIEPTPLPKSSSAPTPAPTPLATPHRMNLSPPKASPSTTPQASPPPAPTATPEKTPAKIEESPATESPTPTATPVKRRLHARKRSTEEQTEPTPEPTPRSRREMRAIAGKLKEMEKEWEASFNDPAVIEKLLTHDFVGTSPGGEIMTKKALLREAKENTSPPPKTLARDLDVHFAGADIAIVTGAARQIDRNSAGQVVEHNYRFTDTWVERDGEWRCVASQSMLVSR